MGCAVQLTHALAAPGNGCRQRYMLMSEAPVAEATFLTAGLARPTLCKPLSPAQGAPSAASPAAASLVLGGGPGAGVKPS